MISFWGIIFLCLHKINMTLIKNYTSNFRQDTGKLRIY